MTWFVPKAARRSALAAALALAGCANAPDMADGPASVHRSMAAADARLDVAAAREMISQYRRDHGLGPVALDPNLQRAALAQSEAMAQAGLLSHEVRGPLGQRLDAAGASNGLAVENVSAGRRTLAEALNAWRASAGHNKNLLEKGVRRMGIATAYAPDTRYKVFWTLVMTD